LIEFKRDPSKGQGQKTGNSDKDGGDKRSLLGRKNLLRISERARRTQCRRSIHVFYAMDLTTSLKILNEASLSPLSNKKRSKRRREGSPPSGYKMSFKPR